MRKIKRTHSASFKSKVALELIIAAEPLSSICSKYKIHPTEARRWKEQLIKALPVIFDKKVGSESSEKEQLIDELYKQIGQLKVELDWLKKNLVFSTNNKRELIEANNKKIPVKRQCELLGINKSTYYYKSVPISKNDIRVMNRIDEIYTDQPYYGYRKITAQLHRENIKVNHKKVLKLMRIMNIQAIVPKKNTSKRNNTHTIYPYLLKGININHPNKVWGTDITYVRANGIWFYLVAIIDWYSRYVISWKLSPSLIVDFCITALNEALNIGLPKYHNSDQGSQFTSEEYLNLLKQHDNIKISMDGRGRCFDNIFTERLWRSVKYEEIYLKDYQSFIEADTSLKKYFNKYNNRRLHESLNYKTPAEIYFK